MAEDISKSTRNQSKNLDKDYTSQMMERLQKLAPHGKVVTDEDFNSRIDMLIETAISEGICPGPETLCLVLEMSPQELCRVLNQRQAKLTKIRNLCCALWEQALHDGKITSATFKSILTEWEKTTNFVSINQPQMFSTQPNMTREELLVIQEETDTLDGRQIDF